MKTNLFLKAIRSGKQQIGLWLSLTSNHSAEVIAHTNFDWVLIDMEHSPNDLQSVLAQLQVFENFETTVLVRPPWKDAVKVKQLLDIGAQGLVFPMVQSAEDAKHLIASTRYPPAGIRGVGSTTRATAFGRDKSYFSQADNETAVILQIETLSALEQIGEISKIEGIDGVFFGPSDIAADMGLIGQSLHPEIWRKIMPAVKKLQTANIPVGTLVLDPEFAKKLLDEGFSFVACGIDAALLASSSDQLLKKMRGN